MMTPEERLAVIEECARALDAASCGFIEVGNLGDETDRAEAYSLAHAYSMAADELRAMDPGEVARRDRNRVQIRTWLKAVRSGACPPLPVVEQRPKDN